MSAPSLDRRARAAEQPREKGRFSFKDAADAPAAPAGMRIGEASAVGSLRDAMAEANRRYGIGWAPPRGRRRRGTPGPAPAGPVEHIWGIAELASARGLCGPVPESPLRPPAPRPEPRGRRWMRRSERSPEPVPGPGGVPAAESGADVAARLISMFGPGSPGRISETDKAAVRRAAALVVLGSEPDGVCGADLLSRSLAGVGFLAAADDLVASRSADFEDMPYLDVKQECADAASRHWDAAVDSARAAAAEIADLHGAASADIAYDGTWLRYTDPDGPEQVAYAPLRRPAGGTAPDEAQPGQMPLTGVNPQDDRPPKNLYAERCQKAGTIWWIENSPGYRPGDARGAPALAAT